VKAYDIVTRWLFILCLPFVIMTGTIAWAFNSSWIYESGFARNNVGLTTGLDKAALEDVAGALVRYWNSADEYIDLTVTRNGAPLVLFNEREAEHLKDVKVLVWLDYRVLLFTGFYCLACAANVLLFQKHLRRTLAGGLVWGSGLTLAAMLALGAGIVAGFDQLFLQFHLFSFANDLWQLDPARDYLIMLVPRDFWYETFLIGAGVAAGVAVVLGGVGGVCLFITRRERLAIRQIRSTKSEIRNKSESPRFQ
jgi:integral membrane protein (TIGR01906 family)